MTSSRHVNSFVALTGALVVLMTLVAACSGGGSLNQPPQAQPQILGTDARAFDKAISPEIGDPERSIVRLAMMQAITDLGPEWRARLNNQTRFIVVFEGPHWKAYANQPGLAESVRHLEQVPGSPTLFRDSSGRIAVLPATRVRLAAFGPLSSGSPIPLQTGQGPYRRIISTAGFNNEQANLDLPTSGAIKLPTGPGVDTGYAYMGGFPDSSYNNEVEMGLQYSSTYGWFTPYYRAFGSAYITDRCDSSGANNPPPPSTCFGYMPNPAHWLGGQTVTEAFGASSWCGTNICGYPQSGNPQVYFTFAVAAVPGCGNTSCESLLLIIEPLPYPYHGWSRSCGSCMVQQIVSIAQPSPGSNWTPSPAEYFGNFHWSYEQLASGKECTHPCGESLVTWASKNTLGCQNYRPWLTSDENNECYSGPPIGAQHTDIHVTGFTWAGTSTTREETMWITLP